MIAATPAESSPDADADSQVSIALPPHDTSMIPIGTCTLFRRSRAKK